MLVDGAPVDPSVIGRTALLTIEAERDAPIGQGDTHRAGRLLARGRVRHRQVTPPGASHPDLFTGPVAARRVAPLIRAFVEAAS